MRRVYVTIFLLACWRAAPETELAPASAEPLWLLARSGQLLRMANDVRQERPFDAPALALTRFDRYLAWATGVGRIWHTSDGGQTWAAQVVPVREALVAISFASPLRGVAVGEHGVLLSTEDGGAHWRLHEWRVHDGLHNVNLRAVKLARQSGVAWAAGEQGVLLHSMDSGRTWSQVALPSTDTLMTLDTTDDGSAAVVAGAHGRAYLLRDDEVSVLGATSGSVLPGPRHGWLAARLVHNGVLLAGQGGAALLCTVGRECRAVAGASEDLLAIGTHPNLVVLGRSGTLFHLGASELEPQLSLADAMSLDDLGTP